MSIKIEIFGDDAATTLADLRALSAALLGTIGVVTLPAAAPAEPETPKAEPAKTTAKAKAAAKAADASTAAKPETAETKAADKADEVAETKAATTAAVEAGKPAIDRDALRGTGGEYAKLYGMPAALEDGPKIIGFASFKAVPDEKIETAYNAMKAAIEQNPFERETV